MRDKLKNMDAETMCFSTINMNSFSDAPTLQGTLEQPLEKKSGMLHARPPVSNGQTLMLGSSFQGAASLI